MLTINFASSCIIMLCYTEFITVMSLKCPIENKHLMTLVSEVTCLLTEVLFVLFQDLGGN